MVIPGCQTRDAGGQGCTGNCAITDGLTVKSGFCPVKAGQCGARGLRDGLSQW